MITILKLENFRCFEKYEVRLKDLNIIVGRNNAGKSTIIEALRLVAIVVARYKNLPYKDSPNWIKDLPKYYKGVSPSIKSMDINLQTVFHRYSEPPAIIKAYFSTKESICLYIGPNEQIFSTIFDKYGNLVKNKSQATNINISPVNILPQIGPLPREENKLTYDYIKSNIFTPLASQHFRNQLIYFNKYYGTFKKLAESSWDGLFIDSIVDNGHSKQTSLIVRDIDFAAEISWMGHGLQMWLQTMWFLAHADKEGTIILDEPDVYMHADLQRKLIRLLCGEHYNQTIITTHSVEIMAEVEPENILVIDSSKRQSKFANNLPNVQKVIDNIGGIHNIQLTRLWSAQKCLLVEGHDLKILKHIQNILFPKSEVPLDTIPNWPIGGWGGWYTVIGSATALRNAADENIKVYCILDSDYHTSEEIEERYDEAEKHNIELHIWSKKELENYLINIDTIGRIIKSNLHNKKDVIIKEALTTIIKELANELYNDVLDSYADQIKRNNKYKGVKSANKMARELIETQWGSLEGQLSIVPGKELISKLSEWTQQEYGVSISKKRIARQLNVNEIDQEIKEVITAIEYNYSML